MKLKLSLAIAVVLGSISLVGCGAPEKKVNSNSEPAPTYVMVPSQKDANAAPAEGK